MRFYNVKRLERDEFTEKIIDFLVYLEIETEIYFDYAVIEGISALVSNETYPSSSSEFMSAEFYRVTTFGYSMEYVIYIDTNQELERVAEVENLPLDRNSEKILKSVTEFLEKIVPDISIIAGKPRFVYGFDEIEH